MRILSIVVGVALALGLVAALEVHLARPAEAHATYVHLHGGADEGWVTTHHDTLIACNNTNNGRWFGVEGREPRGDKALVRDRESGPSCPFKDPRSLGEIRRIRWVEGGGGEPTRRGEWHRT